MKTGAEISSREQEDTNDSLASRADQALYFAKENSRDQVRVFSVSGEHQPSSVFINGNK
ncbi:GGDEF domain-containing protein [Corallincola holothuriorum]|uniref:GGDEF domain-containing protein n=1 Tax=Corallincola holothuriorum TaxID=2282215 RepID=A0A368NQM4_9GAMM|nr:GGDEF domain-containing protein [Corallincola holothuriorum]